MKNGQRRTFGRAMGLDSAYFLALQVGQVAQVALPSAQHFMPQAAVVVSGAQHFLVAQPVTKAEAQTIKARSFNDFMIAMLFCYRCLLAG